MLIFSSFIILEIIKYNSFLIRIHSTQGLGMELQKKEEDKDGKQKEADKKKRKRKLDSVLHAKSSCLEFNHAGKEAADRRNLIISRNGDKKIMQPIKPTSGSLTITRKWNQLSHLILHM